MYSCEEDGTRHGSHVIPVPVCEQVTCGWGVVDFEVVFEGVLWVGDAVLSGPEDLLAFFSGGFCPREENDRLFKVVSVSNALLYVRNLDMDVGIETVQLRDGYFSQSRGSPECGGEAGTYCGVFRVVRV